MYFRPFRYVSELLVDGLCPDLIVARALYIDHLTLAPHRHSVFKPATLLSAFTFVVHCSLVQRHLTSPLFGPGSRLLLSSYADDYCLSADLDYFLKISCFDSLSVLHVQI